MQAIHRHVWVSKKFMELEQEQLKHLLKQTGHLGPDNISELENLVNTWPWFQAAWLMLAKASGESAHIKSAAVRTANRSVLMQLIEGKFDPAVSLPDIDEEVEAREEVNAFDRFSADEDEPQDTPEASSPWDEVPADETLQSGLAESARANDSSEDNYQNETETAYTEYGSASDNARQAEDNFESLLQEGLADELMATLNDLKKTRESLYSGDMDVDTSAWKEPHFEGADFLTEEPYLPEADYPSEEGDESTDTHKEKEEEVDNNSQTATTQQTTSPAASPENNITQTREPLPDKKGGKALPLYFPPAASASYFDMLEVSESPQQKEVDQELFELNSMLDEQDESYLEANKQLTLDPVVRQKMLIDNFIKSSPQMREQTRNPQGNHSKVQQMYDKSVEPNVSIMTETMAVLMYEQGKPQKAIEIYEQLMLKYPHKKVYFASLIEKLKKENL